MKEKLKNRSIKNKVIIICLFSSMIAFFSAGAVFFIIDMLQSCNNLVQEVDNLARIIANNSTAALTFKDQKAGEELLSSFKAEDRIEEIILFDVTGKEFSHYIKTGVVANKHQATPEGASFFIDFIQFRKTVFLGDNQVGQVVVKSNYKDLFDQFYFMLIGMTFAVPLAFFFVWFMASKLQSIISQPISELVKAMQIVQKEKMFSLRLSHECSDEIGQIVKGFNEMLEEVENYDQNLRRSEEKYRYFFNNSEVGIFEMKVTDWLFVIVNPKFESILGSPSTNIVGLSLSSFFLDQQQFRELKDLLYRNKIIQNIELTLKAWDGQIKTILTTLKYDEGSQNVEGSAFDVSEIKALQQKLEEEQSKIIHAGRLSALGEMATGIAHEINQPLTVISLAMQYLKSTISKGDPNSLALQSIEKVTEQIERTSKIIKNMRAFARGGSTSKLQQADVAAVIDNALSFFREQFRINNITLNVSLGSDLPMAIIDSQKFEQVIVNMLSNARYAVQRKFEQTKGVGPMQISVTIFHDHGKNVLVVEVADNGIGMNETERMRCFEPFYTTKEVGQGTGIGLSISYNIIKEFNGTIEAESELGKGSVFRILLSLEMGER